MIIAVFTLLAISVALISERGLFGRFMAARFPKLGSDDFADLMYVCGFMLLFFSLALLCYHFLRFSPVNFTWIGLSIGLLISFLHMFKAWKVMEESKRDKYSGGGSGMILWGCLGFIVFPLLGLLAGYVLKDLL